MAKYDLSVEEGLSQRIAASELRQRQGEGFFVSPKDAWSQTYNQKQNEEGPRLGMGIERERSQVSIFSGFSSRRSPGSSSSSKASSTPFYQSADVVQATPPRLALRKMDLYSSMGSCQTPFHLEKRDADRKLHHTPPDIPNMEAEAQISPSPRSILYSFAAAGATHVRPSSSGPLDRFLEQQDDMANLGGSMKRVEEDQKRIRHSRIVGLRLRTQLRDKRKQLRTKRLAKSAADDAFMKYVRERRSMPLHSSVTQTVKDLALDVLCEAMQTARDEYGEDEFAYNQLEDIVDEHEFELAKMEGRLYNTDIYDIPDPPTTDVQQSAPESLLGISSDAPKEYHPFHISYLTKLGDLDLARERYHNMIDERDSLLLLRQSRLPLGIELHESGKELLANFPSLEAELLGEMDEIEQDVERWKEKCLAEGIELGEDGSGSQQESQSSGSRRHEDIVYDAHSSHSSSLEPSMFPVLLPESVEDKGKLGVLITDFVEGNKSNRINRWMQYQLQTSPSEVELLARVFLDFLQIFSFSQWSIDLYEWQSSVLSWWPRDEANKSPGEFNAAQTHSSVTRSYTRIKPRGCSISQFVVEDTATVPYDFIHRRTKSAPVLGTTGIIFDGHIISRAMELWKSSFKSDTYLNEGLTHE